MSEPAIRVRGVYKKFRRGEQFDSLRDLVAARVLRRRAKAARRRSIFWALHDVSFDVRAGESFGIIGPNGAGKSTMLKLLAGIMRPDRGATTVRGPVSPLIELGAGFHGDLTGRENIQLNACILGMSRRVLRDRFEDIVEFAGIREFLDTPVKRYSSGMYARLGFAIAAYANPRVLLVDEVLSVGDRVFRARCMERMRHFQKDGVAVVFVSHDLGAVANFCDQTLVLSHGRAVFRGPTADAVRHYYEACTQAVRKVGADERPSVHVSGVRLCDANGDAVTSVPPGTPISFHFEVKFDIDMPRPSYGLSILRMDDHLTLFETSSTRMGTVARPAKRRDVHRVRYDFQMNVPPGEYAVGLHVRDRDATVYAADDAFATRILVRGKVVSSGMVHIDPRAQIRSGPQEPSPSKRSSENDARGAGWMSAVRPLVS